MPSPPTTTVRSQLAPISAELERAVLMMPVEAAVWRSSETLQALLAEKRGDLLQHRPYALDLMLAHQRRVTETAAHAADYTTAFSWTRAHSTRSVQ